MRMYGSSFSKHHAHCMKATTKYTQLIINGDRAAKLDYLFVFFSAVIIKESLQKIDLIRILTVELELACNRG